MSPLFLHRKLSVRRGHQRDSVVSVSIEEELDAIADMMSVSVNAEDTISESPESPVVDFNEDGYSDSILDSYLPYDAPEEDVDPHRFSVQSANTTWSQYTAPALTIDSSLSPAESEDEPSDDYCDSAFLSPRSGWPSYHLPRSSPAHGWDSDSQSLGSSPSLSTPSLSRTSSFRHGATAPASPIIPSAYSPVEPPSPPPQGLDVIQERRDSEDSAADWARPGMDAEGRTSIDRSSFSDDQKSIFDYEVVQHRTLRASNIVWERRPVPDLERLRIDTITPETIRADRGGFSPDSPNTSNDGLSDKFPPRPAGGNAIARLFQKTPKSPKASSPRFTKSLEALHSTSNLNSADVRAAAKIEEKLRKKELAKAKKERLAKEAEERDRRRAAADMKRRAVKVDNQVMLGGSMSLGYIAGL